MKMKSLTLMSAASLLLVTAACSQASEAPAQADAEPAPVPVEEPQAANAAPAFELDEGSKALIALMSPKELGMARLSCVRPINSAKPVRGVFDAEMTAELASIDYLSQTDIITSIEGMTIAEARAVMDASPNFENGKPATADEITGLKQCIVLARHYAAEKAAN